MTSLNSLVRMRLISDETIEELPPAKNSRIKNWLNTVERSRNIDGSGSDLNSSVIMSATPENENTVLQLESVSTALERYSSGFDSCSGRSGVFPDRRGICNVLHFKSVRVLEYTHAWHQFVLTFCLKRWHHWVLESISKT